MIISVGLAGKNDLEAARIDEIIDHHRDVMGELLPWLFAAAGLKEGDKNKLYKEVAEPVAQKHFPIYVQLLKQNGTGFLVGSQPSWADLWVSDYLYSVSLYSQDIFKKYPELLEFVKRIQNLPQIKSYIQNRKHSPV